MGNQFSSLHSGFSQLQDILNHQREFSDRLTKESPGIPVPNPTRAFWTVPAAAIADYRSTQGGVPTYADIVIIGSGITGTSIARELFEDEHGQTLNVVMLDAREICTGATGRNGGHITPVLYSEYPLLRARYGAAMAAKHIRFRLAHRHAVGLVALEEAEAEAEATGGQDNKGELDLCQYRETEALDVYYNEKAWADAKALLEVFKAGMPKEASAYKVYEKREALERYQLAPHTVGVISIPAASIHPYRLVTKILTRLLAEHPNFQLYANTPVTSISVDHSTSGQKKSKGSGEKLYTVHTPLGQICTPHVVHATNAYASHLLTPMRKKIIPWRGTMSAQRPGMSYQSASSPSTPPSTPSSSSPSGKAHYPTPFPPGTLSHVFYLGELEHGFDYLTQLPDGEHELMMGGAGLHAKDLGNADDRTYNVHTAMHLSGALSVMFGERNWGAEKRVEVVAKDEDEGGGRGDRRQQGDEGEAGSDEGSAVGQWFDGRVKALWSGIMAYSVDGIPWVGRLPARMSGRVPPPPSSALALRNSRVSSLSSIFTNDKQDMGVSKSKGWSIADPGEWISAGYTGEGMVHAWLSGRALARMILNDEETIKAWFPEIMRVDVNRWKKTDFEGKAKEGRCAHRV